MDTAGSSGMTTELRGKSADFLHRLEQDLRTSNQDYERLAEEIQEYVKLRAFLSKELVS